MIDVIWLEIMSQDHGNEVIWNTSCR